MIPFCNPEQAGQHTKTKRGIKCLSFARSGGMRRRNSKSNSHKEKCTHRMPRRKGTARLALIRRQVVRGKMLLTSKLLNRMRAGASPIFLKAVLYGTYRHQHIKKHEIGGYARCNPQYNALSEQTERA